MAPGPHAHGVYFRGKHLLVPDLGLDKVLTYTLDPATAKPTGGDEPAASSSAPGAGPRHLDFSPDGKHAYVVNELNNTVTAGSYDAKNGTFETLDSVPTLPADWSGKSTTAEIQVHPSGKFVYASNRGHDSIAVFSIDAATGSLTLVEHEPTRGRTPRDFDVDPAGRFLVVANQGTDDLSVFAIDATGLTPVGSVVTGANNPAAVQIVYLP